MVDGQKRYACVHPTNHDVSSLPEIGARDIQFGVIPHTFVKGESLLPWSNRTAERSDSNPPTQDKGIVQNGHGQQPVGALCCMEDVVNKRDERQGRGWAPNGPVLWGSPKGKQKNVGEIRKLSVSPPIRKQYNSRLMQD